MYERDDLSKADANAIRDALRKTSMPLIIRAIADLINSDTMPVARTIGDLVRAGDVTRINHRSSTVYWLTERPVPPGWSNFDGAPSNAARVPLMSQHDEPEDTGVASHTPAANPTPAVTPAKAGAQVDPSAKEATVPTEKTLSPALIDALEQLQKFPQGVKPRELGRVMGIESSVISQRLGKLKRAGYAKSIGWNWHATKTSTGAPLEAKTPQTPPQHTGLNIDKTAKKKPKATPAPKLRPAGPANIDGIDTRSLLEVASENATDMEDHTNERIALTDKHELLVMKDDIIQVIHPKTTRRIAAFLRSLDAAHPLAVAA